jgi:hypothetical protein
LPWRGLVVDLDLVRDIRTDLGAARAYSYSVDR